MKLRAALLLDDMSIRQWQAEALKEALPLLDIRLILNCKNTKNEKNLIGNGLYYVLNVLSLKNKLTKKQRYEAGAERVVDFNSVYQGRWQAIPSNISKLIAEEGVTVVVKFGMSLLKIDNQLIHHDILSFHHGDPSTYRGRPAGFYELLNNEPVTGVVVQKLSNKLDAGDIMAFGQSKVVPHSYKKTAIGFYSISKYLLKTAISNLNENRTVKIQTTGKNYKLPTNLMVLKLTVCLLFRYMARLIYGCFFEKKWKTSISEGTLNLEENNLILSNKLKEIPITSKYNFYADPFFSYGKDAIRLEALDNRTGLGDIVEVSLENLEDQKVLLTGQHYSYPCSFMHDCNEYLLPEVASHSAQSAYLLGGEKLEMFALKGLESKRILDATLLFHNSSWYLFFGENMDAHTVLHLWTAKSLNEEFKRHCRSPVCIAPNAARMGGRIVESEGRIYRFGQNNMRGYGESATILEINALSQHEYSERVCGTVSIDKKYGPHTIDLDFSKQLLLLDYYENVFSPFAGLRRFRAMYSKS